MTPLAHRIAKELVLPAKKRTFIDRCDMLTQLGDLHCFECTEIYDAAMEMMGRGGLADGDFVAVPQDRMEAVSAVTSFLPAAKTWIEVSGSAGSRLGYLIEEKDGFAIVQMAVEDTANRIFASDRVTFGFGLGARGVDPGHFSTWPEVLPDEEKLYAAHVGALNALLAFINSPKIIARHERPAHKGLARKIGWQAGGTGPFKLHPWHEIKLDVTPPEGAGADGKAGERLTGARALHFCRSHLRLRNGRLEMVRGHFRGDPYAGVKQNTYRVTGKGGAA